MRTFRPTWWTVLVLLGLVIAPLASRPTVGANGEALPSVYRVGDPFYRIVQPMDPLLLADVGDPLSFAADKLQDSSFRLSGDGSTAVTGTYRIEGSRWTLDLRVTVTETGGQRASFSAEGRDADVEALSRDGGRVVVSTRTFDKRARLWATNWTVHDATNGEATSTFGMTHPDGQWFTAYVDDGAEHMWLQSSTNPEPNYGYEPEVGALVLQHIDLRTGREVGRLTIGSVEVGLVDGGETVDQEPVLENVYPAIALAPDGRTLAVVEAETEEVILLDGMTMGQIDTFVIGERESLASRLLG